MLKSPLDFIMFMEKKREGTLSRCGRKYMSSEFSVVNIKEMLAEEDGEHMLHLILSDFSCPINPDVERFLLYQSIDFAKRNQSVTYLVLEKKTKN